jgi:hypothetical protein
MNSTAISEILPEDAMNEAKAKADEARKKTTDFEGDSYFPGEWEAAEAQYARGASSASNPETAVAAYNAAADAYDSILNLTIPLYAQAREDEIMACRSFLINGGANTYFSEYLSPADETALQALSLYEKEDFYGAKDSAAQALRMFQVLAAACGGWMLRHEIDERDFILNDPDNYERGGELISEAMDAYKEGDLPLAMEKAGEAHRCYEAVLSAGWASYAELRAQLAEGERQAALDSKTDIAAKAYFSAADSDYKAAQELFEAEQYADAAKLFVGAEAMFVIASMSALEKQSHANTAIREALEKIEESEENAKQAEIIIEGAQNEN